MVVRMPQRIVVIDADRDSCDMICDFLRFEAHDVWTADTGHEGLSAAVAQQASVVICVVQLPDMDGLQIPRLLRSSMRSAPQLIAISGYTQEAAQRAALEAGFH